MKQQVELHISIMDWVYIIIIGAFFGFFISLFFYFLNPPMQESGTIIFAVSTAIAISLFSALLITISNNYILPKVSESFWHLISFGFSFLAGALGVLLTFLLFSSQSYAIIKMLHPYIFYIAGTTGFLTFLIGLILHKFIAMKYRHEEIKNSILESKIKTLEGELNPHFLFNALNSMSELVFIDQKKAEEAVLHLSQFLRNAISKDSLITLEHELEMVQTYVEIENIRFSDKIKLHITLPQTEVLVPKFSIQLLVENAIKHGYMGRLLMIDIYMKDNAIIIENNGKIEDIKALGTGLSNLQKRLELLNVGLLEHSVTPSNKMRFAIKLKKDIA
ncbi:MAG: histidine kinase [Campylobacterales bacterium]|nr:histidine kinase [Campylobacterales bacterium]